MNRMALFSTFVIAIVVFLCIPIKTFSGEQKGTMSIYEAAVDAPNDDSQFKALIKKVPIVELEGGRKYFVIEGDLLLTTKEFREYLVGKNAEKKGEKKDSLKALELLVNEHRGRKDYWRNPVDRRFTYAIDRNSFPLGRYYPQIVEDMSKATRNWESACAKCGIDFVYLKEFDAAPSHKDVLFIVRYVDTGGKFIASAFFPHDIWYRRFINIDPSFFRTRFNRIGVLRHELGHTLGYRHEHTRYPIKGCYFEDDKWFPLTEYDPHSVMHYFCGGGGTFDLLLTDIDRHGHRELYEDQEAHSIEGLLRKIEKVEKAPSTEKLGLIVPKPTNKPVLTVRFEGGKTESYIASVLMILIDTGLVGTESYSVRKGDSICSIYTKVIGIDKRSCPKSLKNLAIHLNGGEGFSVEELLVNQNIKVPRNVPLSTHVFSRSYSWSNERDMRQLAYLSTNWKHLKLAEDTTRDSTQIFFKGYSLDIPVSDLDLANRVLNEVNQIEDIRESAILNVYGEISTSGAPAYPYYIYSPTEHIDRLIVGNSRDGEQGYYIAYTGTKKMKDCAKKCKPTRYKKCPLIILIDKPIHLHPDIKKAVVNDSDINESQGGQKISQLSDDPTPPLNTKLIKEEEHGTHLAGIMVSQDNHYGFVGLSPAAKLLVKDRNKTDLQLSKLIRELVRPDLHYKKVFVFASNFVGYKESLIGKDYRLKNFEDRYKSPPARKIYENPARLLWITAVGQPGGKNPFDEPREIHSDTALAPMNLGDLDNVIVVTACKDCKGSEANLWEGAHYSIKDGLVHIAAPGYNIMGLATSTTLGYSEGTSPATAYVGGVVASMYSCHPGYYESPKLVKRRIQLTARPILNEKDAKKVASGIVDPKLALEDPFQNYFKEINEKPPKKTDVVGWCAKSIHLNDPYSNERLRDGQIYTGNILRITKIIGRDPDQWVIFADPVGEESSKIERIGPGTLSPTSKIVKLKLTTENGTEEKLLSLEMIEELLLSFPVFTVLEANECA